MFWVWALNCLAELHDGEAALAERRPDRRRRIGRSRRHLQFDVAGDFLRHGLLLLLAVAAGSGFVVRIRRLAAAVTSHARNDDDPIEAGSDVSLLLVCHRRTVYSFSTCPELELDPVWRGRRCRPRP